MKSGWYAAGVGLGAAMILALCGPAFACGKGKLLFADSFKSWQPTWGEASDFAYAKDGKMMLNEHGGSGGGTLSDKVFPGDIDVCATFTVLATTKAAQSPVGLAFWGADPIHFYDFLISPEGMASVSRAEGKSGGFVLKPKMAAGARKGVKQSNTLRVVARGKVAELYVNDQLFASITGEPPANGQFIGFSDGSPQNGDATYAADDLKVNVAGPAE